MMQQQNQNKIKPKQRGVYRLGLKATGDPKSNQQPSIADAFKLARDKHEIAKLEKELAEKKQKAKKDTQQIVDSNLLEKKPEGRPRKNKRVASFLVPEQPKKKKKQEKKEKPNVQKKTKEFTFIF